MHNKTINGKRLSLSFFFLLFTQMALIIGYKLVIDNISTQDIDYSSNKLLSSLPYIFSSSDNILYKTQIYLTVYYYLSIAFIVAFIVHFFHHRAKPLSLKWFLALTAGISFILPPWLFGWNLRTINMSAFHLGQVSGHVISMIAICVATWVLCFGAFVGPTINLGERDA